MIGRLAVFTLAFALVSTSALAGSGSALATEPNVIARDGAGTTFLFPIVGSVPGANDTHFRADVTFVNFKDTAQEVLVEFLEAGATVPFAEQRIEIEARKFKFWNDFVSSEISRPGKLGALRVRAVNPGTTVTDSTARINGFSRIWTQQPNGPGTSSMSLPAIDDADLSSGLEPAYIIGARQNVQYRTNLGIVNLANVDRVFSVDLSVSSVTTSPVPFTVTVPARSMMQVPLPEGHFEAILVKVTPEAPGAWSAYTASVDNQSGDAWISKAEYATLEQ